MKIKLIDGSIYPVTRTEIINGRLEIDFMDKSCEEIQNTFSMPSNLSNIELLTNEGEKYGEVTGWTVYGGITMLGDVKTVVLSKPVNITEQRLTTVEADALKAKMIAEDLKENGISFEQNEVLNASVLVAKVSAQELNDADALKAKAIYNTWEELVQNEFIATKSEFKFTHKGELYKTVNENQKFQSDWIPGEGTESIFTRIDEMHSGMLDNPIPAVTNMEYIKGKYYLEKGKIYLMNREGMENGESIVLQFLPSELVGQYFESIL